MLAFTCVGAFELGFCVAALSILLLSGCAASSRPVTAKIAVAIPPAKIKMPDRPAYEATETTPKMPPSDALGVMTRDRQRCEDYSLQLETALGPFVEPEVYGPPAPAASVPSAECRFWDFKCKRAAKAASVP
jgi:hypothetical protein